MLGRQQIAGIPTAISELFKNAHDAYASVAVADYFRSDGLFVLRDDGVGMSRAEFEDRWLVLGTESKVGLTTIPPPDPDHPPRATLGEKGIGRLAIAAIGSQVLVVTRGRKAETTVCALLHWGLFTLPGVDLDQIVIPIREIEAGTLPDASDVRNLVQQARASLPPTADTDARRQIDAGLASFVDVSPADLSRVLGPPSLTHSSGTQFFIRPTDDLLGRDVRDSQSGATDLLRTLAGFSESMTPHSPPQVMRTSFVDHYADDGRDDLIDASEFFTPLDYTDADHRLIGRFDEFGQFSGTAEIYGDSHAFEVPWSEARGRPTGCGPFELRLAVMMGRSSESLLEPDRWKQITDKLERYGGLYVYRDGVRVLPYGNADADFLDIERRRNLSASDYFFSYRRMFGVVALTRADNEGLVEKAGREGFATNSAYRQFRAILMNFLYRAAFEFFRESGTRADAYYVRRGELDRLEKARQRRSQQVRQRRQKFREELDAFFDRLEAQSPEDSAAVIAQTLETQVREALDTSGSEASEMLIAAETQAREALRRLDRSLTVPRPLGVGLPSQLRRLAEAQLIRRREIEEQVLTPTAALVEEIARDGERQLGDAVARRMRFDQAVKLIERESRESAQSGRRRLREVSIEAHQRARDLARDEVAAVESTISTALAEAARLDVAAMDDEEFLDERVRIERQIVEASDRASRALTSVTEQLTALSWPSPDGSPDQAEVTAQETLEALETELEELREQTERDLHLTQLGVAIEVVNHEFRGVVKSIRRDLRRLKTWADSNSQLQEPYRDLRTHFDHLDEYLKLFTPLDRRLYRSRVKVQGNDIERFLGNLFGDRLERHGIQLVASPTFSELELIVYPSSLYPAFVNLIDNALYWLADYPASDRVVRLDVDQGDILISDTGPGVSPRDREAIFDVGFSRKPAGSGYGLHVSRRALAAEEWELTLDPPSAGRGAAFRLTPPASSDQADLVST